MGYDLWEEGELKTLAKDSLLTKLVKTLDIDVEKWVSSAVSVLPETLRVTTSRSDIEWTKQELRIMGGKPIPWMPNESAWQMPFLRGKPPNDYAKRMMTILPDSGRITRQEAASMLPVEIWLLMMRLSYWICVQHLVQKLRKSLKNYLLTDL